MELRFQLSAGQLEDTSKSLKVRRDIARVRTAMNNKDKAA
jgi:ribosomal protein L29